MKTYKNITLDQGALKLDGLGCSNSVVFALAELAGCDVFSCRANEQFMRIWATPTHDEIVAVKNRAAQIAAEINDDVVWAE